jgi:hypothetical protein
MPFVKELRQRVWEFSKMTLRVLQRPVTPASQLPEPIQ